MSADEGVLCNVLLQKVNYKIVETPRGVWKSYLYPSGQLFEEFVSHGQLLGWPLLHFTRGVSPETGKRVTAKGIIAIGRFAKGVIAIGQVAFGLIALGQLAIGLFFGLGQACSGLFALGQASFGGVVGLGQFATGYICIGQFGFGHYVLAQVGWGDFVWDSRAAAEEAKAFFKSWLPL